MLDSEKIIKGLTECVAAGLEKACPGKCPYFLQCFPDVGLATPFMSLMADALALLKEQEAVKPILEQDSMDAEYADMRSFGRKCSEMEFGQMRNLITAHIADGR